MGKIQGVIDSPLTKLTEGGIAQAKQLAKILSSTSSAAIYCSNADRAVKTAEIIAVPHNKKPVKLPELHEIDCGKFEGLTIEERRRLYAEEDDERNMDKFNNPFPGGESYATVKERLKPFVEMIKKKHASNEIIVVMHQGSGRTLVSMLAGLSNQELVKVGFPHNIVYEINSSKESRVSYIINGKREEGVLYR